MRLVRFLGLLSFALLLTVAFTTDALAAQLRINGPKRIGVPQGKPFIFLIPATGEGSLSYQAEGLPEGLSLNSQTGVIEGTSSAAGSHKILFSVTDMNATVTREVEMVVDSSQTVMALTPIMGWNPWYVWGCNIDDKKMRDAADLLVSTGLAAHGYNYINLDDCWQGERDANGEMIPNSRFPDMKALADYVHSKGLRIGIYTGPGDRTCAGYRASKGHLEQDVQTYAKWGMDFVKYDWCIQQPTEAAPYIKVYQEMTDILSRSPRAMVHMICQYGNGEPWKWGAQVGGNMWRTDHDLADTWEAFLRNGIGRIKLSKYAKPGHWNDLDMLMVGKANWPDRLGQYNIPNRPPRPTKLTLDEQKSHMTLWSMLASPLLFSGDLAQLADDKVAMEMLTNVDMVDINQDSLGAPVKVSYDNNGLLVIHRPLADGSVAVAMFNLTNRTHRMLSKYSDFGLPAGGQFLLRNIWGGFEKLSDPSHTAVFADVPSHGVLFLKITPQ